MGVCLGDLDARQVERLRTELAETLAANFAYPPFFDYTAGHAKARPVDREKRQEIAQYLSSVSFSSLDRVDVRSPDLRRFLERLLLRYIEVNPVLGRQQYARRLSEMRATVPRAAAQIQRGLVALTEGSAPAFGARRPVVSWSGQSPRHAAPLPEEELEYHTGVLQATLSRSHQAVSPPSGQAPATGAGLYGAFGAIPQAPSPGSSLDRQPTRPVPSVGAPATPRTPEQNGHASANGPRELPPELYQLYGDYLTDMHVAVRRGTGAPTAASPSPANGGYATGAPAGQGQWQAPASAPAIPAQPTPPTGNSRQDEVIFAQLRYQVEAYVRRAARNYGLAAREGDPARVMDALRISGLVDEADLRVAEGILALTDRVARQGHASLEDYRQAFMLYLLYHRGHLGE
jgi:hypothetical protein